MTVFKNYFKILKSYRGTIILYTVILLFFSVFTAGTSKPTESFEAEKPTIVIINQDTDNNVTKNLIEYIEQNAEIKEIKEDKIEDALFYREIHFVLYIYNGYGKDFQNGIKKTLETKSAGNYESSYMEMILNRYLKFADIYQNNEKDINETLKKLNETLKMQGAVETKNSENLLNIDKVSFYFSFANYSLLAISIYVIAMIMNRLNEKKVKNRTLISSTKMSKINKELYLASFLFSIIVWGFIVAFGFVIGGKTMMSIHGLYYILNSFIFMLCSVSIGFLLGNLIKNTEAINGIVNVVALGSSFLCGCFVPVELLPDFVVKFAKFLPSYWYIQNNNLIGELSIFSIENLSPIFINMIIICAFTVLFIIIMGIYTKYKKRTN